MPHEIGSATDYRKLTSVMIIIPYRSSYLSKKFGMIIYFIPTLDCRQSEGSTLLERIHLAFLSRSFNN